MKDSMTKPLSLPEDDTVLWRWDENQYIPLVEHSVGSVEIDLEVAT